MKLALEMGMTLAELQDRMTPAELQLWLVYFEMQHEQQEAARRRASRL